MCNLPNVLRVYTRYTSFLHMIWHEWASVGMMFASIVSVLLDLRVDTSRTDARDMSKFRVRIGLFPHLPGQTISHIVDTVLSKSIQQTNSMSLYLHGSP